MSAPFPIEKAPTCKIMSSKDTRVMVSKLLNYPVKGLVFEGGNTLHDLCDAVASSCTLLESNNVSFNILISDCGKRVFLLPQVNSFSSPFFMFVVATNVLSYYGMGIAFSHG